MSAALYLEYLNSLDELDNMAASGTLSHDYQLAQLHAERTPWYHLHLINVLIYFK